MKKSTLVLPEPKVKLVKDKNGAVHEYYRIVLKFPIDPIHGTKRPNKDIYANTKKECITKATKAWEEYTPIVPNSKKDTPLMKFLLEEFLPIEKDRTKISKEKKGISWAHYVDRKFRLERYLCDPSSTSILNVPLRHKKLGQITPLDIHTYFKALEKAEVSPFIVRFLKSDLRTAFAHCLNDLAYPRAQLFDGITIQSLPEPDTHLHDVEQFLGVLYDETKPLMWRTLILFALETMSRPSEQFAILWSDIDWDHKTVRIDKAMRKAEGGNQVSPGTKRGMKSNRTISLSADLIGFLKRLHVESTNRSFVFATGIGVQIKKDNFPNIWSKIKKELNLPKDCPSYYKWKHTGSSWLQSLNVSKTAIKERMGHSPKSVLAETTYRRATKGEKSALMDAFTTTLQAVKKHEPTPIRGKSVVNFRIKSLNRKFQPANK